MIEGMPEGLPKRGDRGLDRTPTWGRTYWGGALFWLLADIEIRERSGGRKSLDDALRAIVNDGGDGSAWWPAKKIFALGDKAIGMPVLETLHKKMGGHPAPTDLGALWKSLGVSLRENRITFTDDAPLAAIRRALTRPSVRTDVTPPSGIYDGPMARPHPSMVVRRTGSSIRSTFTADHSSSWHATVKRCRSRRASWPIP